MIPVALAIVLAPWWPGGSSRWSSAPDYPERITVVDQVAGGPAWRHDRDRAIDRWNRCGADVRLVAGAGEAFEPGTVTLFVDDDDRGQDGPYGGFHDGYGFAALYRWAWSRLIEHELGHALGFGHGGTGAMSPAAHVNAGDCRGLRSYYGRRR